MTPEDADLHCPRISEIVTAVCDHYRLSRVELLSDRRAREVARPRQIAMWIARNTTFRSLPEIARYLRRGDHTTIMHGIRTIDKLIREDEYLVADMHAIRRRLAQRVMIREALEQTAAA